MVSADKVRRQMLATRLLSGEVTDSERDEALAQILLTLWERDDVTELIDMRLKEHTDKYHRGSSLGRFFHHLIHGGH